VLSGALDNTSEGNHIVLQVINHEEYDSFSFANDIAVWQVEPPFEWGPQTGPVGLLAQDTPSPTGTLTTVSGWGTTSVRIHDLFHFKPILKNFTYWSLLKIKTINPTLTPSHS